MLPPYWRISLLCEKDKEDAVSQRKIIFSICFGRQEKKISDWKEVGIELGFPRKLLKDRHLVATKPVRHVSEFPLRLINCSHNYSSSLQSLFQIMRRYHVSCCLPFPMFSPEQKSAFSYCIILLWLQAEHDGLKDFRSYTFCYWGQELRSRLHQADPACETWLINSLNLSTPNMEQNRRVTCSCSKFFLTVLLGLPFFHFLLRLLTICFSHIL